MKTVELKFLKFISKKMKMIRKILSSLQGFVSEIENHTTSVINIKL